MHRSWKSKSNFWESLTPGLPLMQALCHDYASHLSSIVSLKSFYQNLHTDLQMSGWPDWMNRNSFSLS